MANIVSIAFCKAGSTQRGVPLPVIVGSSLTSYTITSSASNQQSSAGPSGASIVRIATDTAIYAAFGSNPDATTTTARILIPANGVEFVFIGEGDKVGVVNA